MLNREIFFEKFNIEKEFQNSGLSWSTLEKIYDDFAEKEERLFQCCNSLESFISDGIIANHHSVTSRVKDPMHLIEKIIRKTGKEQSKKYERIDETNYYDIIHDLIGVRILVLAKEDWEGVFDWLTMVFPEFQKGKVQKNYMAEKPIAYTRYGDRDIFRGKIKKQHSNRGYRSQHYVVKYDGFYCEIQVRTLAEEVYGEFDHFVKYPYRENNKFLKRYTSSIAQLLDSVDEMMSTCLTLKEQGWQECEKYYEADRYIDWQNTYQLSAREDLNKSQYECTDDRIDCGSYANSIFLRKE